MRQLALVELRLSPALQAADPAALSRQGLAASSAVGSLRAQAGRLDALESRLEAGLWVSPASAQFIRAAQEQARRLRVAADLCQALASALGTLAAALQRARADALAAVIRAGHLDAAALELNRRLLAQPTLVPQDPDSRLLSDPEADLINIQRQASARALALAEASAASAWQHASAAFDAVSYGTPVMRQRMETGRWELASSVSLASGVLADLRSCGVMQQLGLPANGQITGPDGRAYSVVVQTARGRDGQLLVSTQETPSAAGDWHELAVRFGTTEYGRRAAGWEKVAVAVGGVAGAAYPEGSTFAPELLSELHIMAGGGAYVPELAVESGDPVKEAPAEPPRGQEHSHYWTRPTTGVAGGRRAGAPDAIGLIDAGIAGVLLAGKLDDSRAADYRIVFEEDSAGHRQARLQLFRVLVAPNESPRTIAAGGYVDAHGHLAGIAVTGESPQLHPILTPGH